MCYACDGKRKRTLFVESREKKNEHCRAVVVVVVTPSEKKQGFVFVCSVRSFMNLSISAMCSIAYAPSCRVRNPYYI